MGKILFLCYKPSQTETCEKGENLVILQSDNLLILE